MPIIRVKTSTEKYRTLAMVASHSNELTGRGLDVDSTMKRTRVIRATLESIQPSFESMIDLGCGDGAFMEALSDLVSGQITGILPSEEEIEFVSKLNWSQMERFNFELGVSDKIPLPSGTVDLLVCNSVLHGKGFDKKKVEESLAEIARVCAAGGVFYLGEIPQTDERFSKGLKARGLMFMASEVLRAARRLLLLSWAAFSRRNIVIMAQGNFYHDKEAMKRLLESYGFSTILIKDSNTGDDAVDRTGRLDYVCKKM